MKRTKRISALLLLLCMLLSFSGCGGETQMLSVPSPDINTETKGIVTVSPGETVPAENTVQGKMRAHFLDVGQGDAVFVELADGQTMLIDAGNAENGNEIVSYIRNLQYESISCVVATHPHADHIGGMTEVLNAFKIGKMYMPRMEHASRTFENMLDAIEENNIDLYTARAGINILTNKNLRVDILSPWGDNYSDLNNFSAVVKIMYGDTSFLFTGDAEAEVETELLNEDIDADVLKVGHHGSDTSSSERFIQAVSPSVAVISAGKGNPYGHPHGETLAILQKYNTEIYRTDEVGTIIVTADGSKNISVDKNASAVKENAPPTSEAAESAAPKQESAGVVATSVAVTENTVSQTPVPTAVETPEPVITPVPTPEPVITKAPTPAPVLNEAAVSDAVVYRTRTGEKYHRSGCSYLKSKIETTVSQAKAMGLTPCKRCTPPA